MAITASRKWIKVLFQVKISWQLSFLQSSIFFTLFTFILQQLCHFIDPGTSGFLLTFVCNACYNLVLDCSFHDGNGKEDIIKITISFSSLILFAYKINVEKVHVFVGTHYFAFSVEISFTTTWRFTANPSLRRNLIATLLTSTILKYEYAGLGTVDIKSDGWYTFESAYVVLASASFFASALTFSHSKSIIKPHQNLKIKVKSWTDP